MQYKTNKIHLLQTNILILMYSTCFVLEGLSLRRRFYVQVWYSMF
jgi:hypothetical protein